MAKRDARLDWPTQITGPLAVVGDVHGQSGLLGRMIARLLSLPDAAQRWIVFAGDLVDRGPDTHGVLAMVLELQACHGKVAAVAGNHDLAMGCALGVVPSEPQDGWAQRWLDHYHSEVTFHSYGLPHAQDLQALATLRRAVPVSHRRLLAGLPWVVEHPSVVVVHAGLEPEHPVADQLAHLRAADARQHRRPPWLCRRSLAALDPPADEHRLVISGHQPQPSVVFRPRRALVDTGAGWGGALSAALWPECEAVVVAPDAAVPRQLGGSVLV
jgi:serine/threonine protein phosphatase 1